MKELKLPDSLFLQGDVRRLADFAKKRIIRWHEKNRLSKPTMNGFLLAQRFIGRSPCHNMILFNFVTTQMCLIKIWLNFVLGFVWVNLISSLSLSCQWVGWQYLWPTTSWGLQVFFGRGERSHNFRSLEFPASQVKHSQLWEPLWVVRPFFCRSGGRP